MVSGSAGHRRITKKMSTNCCATWKKGQLKCTREVRKCRDTRLRMKPVANHMKQAWRGCERLNGKQQDQFCDDFGSCPLRWTVRERQSPWVIVLASFNKGIDAKNLCGRREVLDASLGKKGARKGFSWIRQESRTRSGSRRWWRRTG